MDRHMRITCGGNLSSIYNQFLPLEIFKVSNEGDNLSKISKIYNLPCFTLNSPNVINEGGRFFKISKY